MQPFDQHKFLGYVSEVSPGFVKMQLPSALHLGGFYHSGEIYNGGSVGGFVVIEGGQYGFLGRLFELTLAQNERMAITEQNLQQREESFHPVGKIEILALFSVYEPEKIVKTVSRYPEIGAKVFSCSKEQIGKYISTFGIKTEKIDETPFVPLGRLTSNDEICSVSLNSLFGRHCAILGTTGGGKSWTVAKLIELYTQNTKSKCILVDATGEYGSLDTASVKNVVMGTGNVIFDYKNLTVDEMFFLLHPSAKVQVPKLMEAIRSLKMIALDANNELALYYPQDQQTQQYTKRNLIKFTKSKKDYRKFYYQHVAEIEDKQCRFDFGALAHQITNECCWDNGDSYGNKNENDVSNCISLISRVNNVGLTDEYNRIFGFRKNSLPAGHKDLTGIIDVFLGNNDKNCLRLDFSEVGFDYQVREILVNAIGKYMLNLSRKGKFKDSPVVVFIDEAHQFLNKSIADEYFAAKPLDAFEQISKETRKYGLFLCIATQMPRDIPLGTLSQMGTFIVHRLINEQDKKAVESAASSVNRNSLSYLPILGEGEALMMGVDFPMPLTLKIIEPQNKPNSNTPKLKKK